MSKEIPDEVLERINQMTEAYRQKLIELWGWSHDEESDQPPTAVEMEDKIQEKIREIGEDTQLLALKDLDRHRRKGKQPCPECGEAVYWERYEGQSYSSGRRRVNCGRSSLLCVSLGA